MSWLTSWRRQDSNSKDAWGYRFQWTEDHKSPKQYDHLKYTYDTLGEECVNILDELYPAQKSPQRYPEAQQQQEQQYSKQDGSYPSSEKGTTNPPKRDLYVLLRDHHKENEKLQQLWDEVTTVPSWVDWDQISQGQEVFYRYGAAVITGLAYQSLLGGTGSSRVSEVLARTGGFSIKTVRNRLLETTQHILQCTSSLSSIKPGGDGFASSVRVRLLHSIVRRRILQLATSHPSYYSVEKNGVPINDLDSIGTIAVFSSTIIWQSLPRQGIFLREQEISAYIAFWRLVAHYVGAPTEFFSTPAKAKAIMESLYLYEIAPSPTSKLHARNIIRALENTPPAYASRAYLEVNTRWLNGNQLSDALDIGKPHIYYWALTAGQCVLYMILCYTCRLFPALDRHQINSFRKILWYVVESKEWGLGSPSAFDFKYIPGYGRCTKDEGDVEERNSTVFWTADRSSGAMLFVILFIICLSIFSWCKAAAWIWREAIILTK